MNGRARSAFSDEVIALCVLCTIVTPAHTQEEVTHLGCTFLVASLVARKGGRPSAAFAGGI